jgi:hypothetical protein
LTTDTRKRGIPAILEFCALVTATATILTFVIGNIAAYFYFSAFDIQYLKYADTKTAFGFALESIDVVIAIVILTVSSVLLFGVLIHKEDLFHEGRSWKSIVSNIKSIVLILLFFGGWIYIVSFCSDIVNSTELRSEIKENRFVPYEVILAQDKISYKCMTSLGTIGPFQVFISQSMQPIMIQRSNIMLIKQMASPVPLKVIGYGKTKISNPHFENEMKIWSTKWAELCGSIEKTDFKRFDFTTDATQRKSLAK